jgi:fructose-bisphosphate aldolase class II
MRDMLQAAISGGYAVGYFEAWDQYSLEAAVEAAEELRSPTILGFGGVMMNQEWFASGGLRALGAMGRAVAESARVPVAYLLNEVATHDLIRQGLDCGFNALMLDTSHLPLAENIAQTRMVVEAARGFGADVEGECDPLPDASGMMGGHTGSRLTDPETAARYVAETGVRALSIAIGNEHIRIEGEASIDFELLARIRDAVPVPLVIHGGTGFADSAVRRAIELGVAKFNVGSVLKNTYLRSAREAISSLPEKPNFQELVGSRKPGDFLWRARQQVKREIMRRMRIYGSAGKV